MLDNNTIQFQFKKCNHNISKGHIDSSREFDRGCFRFYLHVYIYECISEWFGKKAHEQEIGAYWNTMFIKLYNGKMDGRILQRESNKGSPKK